MPPTDKPSEDFLRDLGNRPQDTWTGTDVTRLFLIAIGCNNLRAAASSARSQEPVAWRWHWIGGDEPDVWGYLEHEPDSKGKVIEPLYADASATSPTNDGAAIEKCEKYLHDQRCGSICGLRKLARSEGRDA